MSPAFLADLLVAIHLGFILFVVLGGFLVLRFPRLAWLHLPAAVWGAAVVGFGWICPLTPWEQRFRLRAGEEGYAGGFIEHYIVPVIYPEGLTRGVQIALGLAVVGLNAGIYAVLIRRRGRG